MAAGGCVDCVAHVVLRGVPAALAEHEVAAALDAQVGGGCRVERFRRTAHRTAGKPLQLVRVHCSNADDAERLLQCGATIEGVHCAGEASRADVESPAALGTTLVDVEAIDRMLDECARNALLCPLDAANAIPVAGERVFCAEQGRVSRGGWHGILLDTRTGRNSGPTNRAGCRLVASAASTGSDTRGEVSASWRGGSAPEGGPAQVGTGQEGGAPTGSDCGDGDSIGADSSVLVRCLDDGNERYVRGDRIISLVSSGSSCVLAVCATTAIYRRLAMVEVCEADCVLEIGSDLGTTTALISSRCASKAVGVDISAASVRTASSRYPGIEFHHLDVLSHGAGGTLHALCPAATGRYDKVFIDINGNRPLHAVAEVLAIVLRDLHPTNLVVAKSRELFSWVGKDRARRDNAVTRYEQLVRDRLEGGNTCTKR